MTDPEQNAINGSELQEENLGDEVELAEDVEPVKRRIFTDKSDPPVASLHRKYRSGQLVLDPIFQRRRVWDEARSSRLVESVLLEVPIPVLYLAEGRDGTLEVIDGQQRLSSLFRFLDNQYSLRSLRALPHLNGKLFRDLDTPLQAQIEDYAIRVVVFRKESDENLRFEIFERLNTGAVPLNAQELRNCVYRGPYNDLLIELSTDPTYRKLLRIDAPEKRMRDVEYVLRFAAFWHSTYLKYKPSMARFMNEDMRTYRNIGQEDAEKLTKAFKNSVALVWSLLGEKAFRRFYPGGERDPNGRWEPQRFNAALYDILMFSFADADKNQIMGRLDSIREAYINLMTNDPEFIESIELSTSSTRMVTRRFDKWRAALDAVLKSAPRQPRTFSRELKQELYDRSPACAICGQHISHLDDAAVDHIEQYWLGGKTIPENARLAHRYCNGARPRGSREAQG